VREVAAGERFLAIESASDPQNCNFPVKFPVSREFAWRPVRSALRCQGGSPVRTRIFPFPILPMRTISWGPVARANLPKMDGSPGASEACPACVENRSLRPTAFGAKRPFTKTTHLDCIQLRPCEFLRRPACWLVRRHNHEKVSNRGRLVTPETARLLIVGFEISTASPCNDPCSGLISIHDQDRLCPFPFREVGSEQRCQSTLSSRRASTRSTMTPAWPR
jgi:hypothetical protein